MPKFPAPATRAESVRETPFGVLAPLAAKQRAAGKLYPFHLGDSHLLPAEPARRIDLDRAQVHRYCPVPGLPDYREAVAAWVGEQMGTTFSAGQAFATPGCTGALSIVTTALFDEKDEVLVVTPVWPLILGILSSHGVVPVEVAVGEDGWPEPDPGDLRERLLAACTERTAGLYICDPNNPAGFVTPRAHMEVLRDVATEKDLWMVVDVVYKDLIFGGSPWHAPMLLADGGGERLILGGSFSKSHVLAGHRAGFIIAPEHLERIVTRVITHCPYHASTSAQEMAVAALGCGAPEIERIRSSYEDGLEAACGSLHARYRRPQAGAFLFLDLRELVEHEDAAMDLMIACLEAGVALAPGSVFGADFPRFARLCYTANPPATVAEGIAHLNPVLDSWKQSK